MSAVMGEGSAQSVQKPGGRVECNRVAARVLVAACTLGSQLLFFGLSPASAASAITDPVANLQAYMKAVVAAPGDRADGSLTALRDFVRDIGAPQSVLAPTIKLAEADNAVDALREFFSGHKDAPTTPEQATAPAAKPVRASKPTVEASYVGTKVCLGCHTSQAEGFGHTLMGRLMKQGKIQCETCHGPGSEHARLGGGRGVGGIISFRKDDPSRAAAENNTICLGCHERGERTYWSGSVHETRGLACTDCHTVMKTVSRKFQLKTAFEPDTCFQCHKDRRAQMARSSHMPLGEGKIVCSDCHNPHGSFTEGLLRTASINDTCYKCHAEKRGPFLFEHLPVRENCLNCHDPHGSVNEFMLKVSRPRLCTECHTFGHGGNVTGPLVPQAMSRSCQNCHTEVHGTNSPSGALLHR